MKFITTETKISPQNLKMIFDRKVSAKFWELDNYQIYGYMNNNKFILGVKLPLRSIKQLFNDELSGYVEDNGTVHYRFQRTFLSAAVTCIIPLLITAICLVVGCLILKTYEMAIGLPVALLLFACNFIRLSHNRHSLENFLISLTKQEKSYEIK